MKGRAVIIIVTSVSAFLLCAASAVACGRPTPPPRPTAGPLMYTVSLADGTIVTCVKYPSGTVPGFSVEKNGSYGFETFQQQISQLQAQLKSLTQKLKANKRKGKKTSSLSKKISDLRNQIRELDELYPLALQACQAQ